ncbi:hypothetical protein CBL_10736 [Carabus blaptoides fortunei]
MSDLHEDAENVELTDQENIIMNIFTLCDIEKTGLVSVSKLIEFISPYIDFNSAHLEELRKSLDPLQKDPYVTNKVFFKSMKEWTDKFKNEFQANCTPTEIIDPNSKRLSDVDQRQSTPTKNFAKGFFKGEYESGILNLSNISSYSYAGSTAGAFDPGILQEQINELQHQNRKLNEMLSEVRVQLNVSEEQNGALQNDMQRITKRLQAEQKVNEHLQKERKENDEYRENTNNIIKKYETLNQNLISYKKENAQLKNQIIDYENEIQKLQEVVTKARNNSAKKNQTIEELQIEIEIREKEIATLEECKRQLNQICKNKEDGIQQLIDETQHLQYEKIALEKRLSEVISRSASCLQQEKHEIPEPESNPVQRMSKSASPNVSSDDDYYWGNVLSTVQPYESLQSELMQVSTGGCCVGSCDHKMKQTQYEQEIESLQCELKQHENCQNAIEKYERELKESKERMDKYENDLKALQTELDEAKTERNTEEIQEKLRESEEKFTNAQQEKENEIRKLKVTEEELRKEYDGKTKELANLKCEVRKFGEKVDNCKLELQRSMCDKAMFEEELKKAKELNEIYEEQCRIANKNLEDMIKKIEAKDKEKAELTKDVEERDRENSELINSNRNFVEQMTMYKENYLLVQQEFSSLNEDYCTKREELNEAKEQFEQLNDEFEMISSKYEENEKKLKEMQQVNEVDTIYKKENLKLKADCEKLTVDLEAKTKRIETLENACSAMKEENENKLHAFNAAMEEKVQQIHEEHALKVKEIISYQENKMKQFDWLIVQKSGLEDALDTYEMKYKDATEKLLQAEELRTSYEEALAKLKESENHILKLEEDLEETMAQIDSLELAQEEAEIKRIKTETIMKEKITALENELSVMQHKLREPKAVSEDPVKTTTCTNCSNLDIERKSANAKTETRKSTRVELLHHKIEKLDEQLDEEKNRTKTLAENLTKVQNEKDDLESKLVMFDDERKQLLLQKDAGQTRIKKLTHTVQGLELKMNTYKNTIEDISRQVEFRTKDMAQMEMRFSDLQLKSNKISYTHSLLVTHMGVVRQKIVDQKKILGGNTLYAVNVWRTLLENVSPTSPILKQDPSDLVSTTSESTAGPLDEEIHNLGQQINLTCILLKTLAKLRDQFQTLTEHGDGSRTRMEEKSVETGNESVLSAVVKRNFVLKPASFIIRTNPLNTSPMSPDSPAAEMADVPSPKEYTSPRVELNNNDIQMDEVKLRSNGQVKKSTDDETRKSFASDLTDSGSTSSDSGSSESLGIEVVAKRHIEPKERLSAGESKIENEKEVQEGLARQFRSMSEGAVVTHQLTDDGDVTVFPNLRDNVLETLGLLPDGQAKERLSEDEIEVKFQTLTLAFAIDAVTLADRRDRQKRQRDQAENNMATEVARLTYAIHRLNPLCIDAETTEMVTSLLSQLDVILQASNRISTSAEVFGSVQQEWRLAESVNVMLSHLRNLRQQRDTARRQLQCTKRMLQESTTTTEPTNPINRPRISSTNGRVGTRRRASIATITRPLESPRSGIGSNGCAATLADGTVTRRVTTRRTSTAVCEPSSRHWDSRVRQDWSPVDRPATLLRSRPSRLELGVDLVKIKEGAVESSTSDSFEKYDSDTEFRTPTATSNDDVFQDEVAEPTTLPGHMKRKLLLFGAQIEAFWNYLVEQGTIHEICCMGAIVCFALSTIIIGNLLLEVEHARRGIPMQRIPLEWLTWDELMKLIFGDTPSAKGGPY